MTTICDNCRISGKKLDKIKLRNKTFDLCSDCQDKIINLIGKTKAGAGSKIASTLKSIRDLD